MPNSEYLRIEVAWLDQQGLLMTNEEFGVYIRGPWRFARDLGANRVEFRGMARISAARCGISLHKFTKIIEKIISQFDCLTWEDESHNVLRIHGVSRVHGQMRRFQNRFNTGTDDGNKPEQNRSNTGEHEVEVEVEVEVDYEEWWGKYRKVLRKDPGSKDLAKKRYISLRKSEKSATKEFLLSQIDAYAQYKPFPEYTPQDASVFLGKQKAFWKKEFGPGDSEDKPVCPYCRLPILRTDRTTNGRHRACYLKETT